MGQEEPNQKQNRILLISLTAAFALSHLDRQILAITLNEIGMEFQLSDLQLGMLSGIAFALIYVVLGFPVAKLVRPGNRKIMVTGALTIWSAMTAMMGLTNSFITLFLARVGVGIGEAGCVPPSHSMISEAYPKEKRAGALAFYSAGANVGLFLAFLVGGIIAARFGWRFAFLLAGILGLLLAVWMLRLKEPVGSEKGTNYQRANFRTVIKLFITDASIKHAIIGASLTAIVGFGTVAWVATYLIRSHSMSVVQVGIYLAVVIGIFGALGTWAGGVSADKLGARDKTWPLKFVAIIILLVKPFQYMFYFYDNTMLALAFFIIPAAAGSIFIGPTLSHAYSRIKPADRPMMTAIFMFWVNLIGLGLGPVLIGLMSDNLAASFGSDSLRISLAIIQIVSLWAAVHFWLAGKKV